jgi:uncharacterized membrane protein YccC
MPLRPLHRLPAFAVNGIGVAVGIGLIQLLIGALAGSHAAQLALSGAVCASLADVPNTPSRTLHRVAAAAALSLAAALVVAVLKPYPIALGVGVAGIAFVAMMTMAWGARAGAVSFAPILSLVFSMAVPKTGDPLIAHVVWNAVGGASYLAWSLIAGMVLQRRYRTLALVSTLRAAGRLLRSRAALLEAPQATDALAMQAWITGEAELAEQLQSARDFVFAEADTERARRDTAILLRAIDLRDVLLASRLDLDRLGSDATGRWILQTVAQGLRQIGQALDSAADALRDGTPPPPLTQQQYDLRDIFADAPIAHHDARTRLLPAILDRLRNISSDVTRIHALLHGDEEEVLLTREQLQRFVAPEGWPLKALRAQMSTQSPVFRHAVRSALALGSAYFLALALPWASHPHWLVLSVAVVLRGNLEQTLSRRNARVFGTMLGCAVVLALSHLITSKSVLGLVFLAAVGTAHTFVMQRYWLTASAATVMALLQSHMVDPTGGFAVAERVADTVLGAALAWGFSYVLPSWERRSLPRAIGRVLKELRDYANHALAMQSGDAVEQRLARRRAYDALSALAITLQRSAAEPKAVQVPVREVAALLDHGQRLMAHLSMVRMMLTRRGSELEGPTAATALKEADAALSACLSLREPAMATGGDMDPEELSLLPMQAPAEDVTPWLMRRLQVLIHDARRIRDAAAAAVSVVKDGVPTSSA